MKTPTTFIQVVEFILDFINILIPTLFAFLFLYVVWKIIDLWVIHGDDEGSQEKGRQLVVTAVIVFVLMISAWGIIALIKTSIFG